MSRGERLDRQVAEFLAHSAPIPVAAYWALWPLMRLRCWLAPMLVSSNPRHLAPGRQQFGVDSGAAQAKLQGEIQVQMGDSWQKIIFNF